MVFRSILFEKVQDRIETASQVPSCFADLNLDQIVAAVTAGKQEYDLKPFFYLPLHDVGAIEYRHEIFRDLEKTVVFESIKSFAHKMRAMREHLAQADKLYYRYQKGAWFLDAVEIYCDAVSCFARDLSVLELRSRGFLALRDYVAEYVRSEGFTALLAETKSLKADLSGVRYCVLVKGNSIKVRKYESEKDFSIEVEETFEKFRQGAVKDYRAKFSAAPDMNHVEAQILGLVGKLYPDIFSHLDGYRANFANYLDETIGAFDRQIQFYIAYIEFIAPLKSAGLPFCYPQVSDKDKHIYDREGFDLALAYKLNQEKSAVVCNDFYLKDRERIFVVTGPNQGGKTTFARAFGQLHYLASLGCPAQGREARLFLFDRLLVHFEREEHIENLRGKLEDDLVRIHGTLNEATPESIIILNEIFTSTTLQDALFLSKEIMTRIVEQDVLCVCVTFLDELASFGEKTVSLVSTVSPENPAVRTFRIVRKPADGLAYAHSIAEKYRLTYDCLRERLEA
jgi:DNA mismatch repair protein MutS